MRTHDLDAAYSRLLAAVEAGPRAQLDLLAVYDETVELLEELGSDLTDADLLRFRVVLDHAQTMLGRYFGG